LHATIKDQHLSANWFTPKLPDMLGLRSRTQALFIDYSEDLLSAHTHADVVRQVNPADSALAIDQEFGGPRNINPFRAPPDMPHIISEDDLLLGIRKEWESEAGFFTQPLVDLHRVNTHGHHANAASVKLAQLLLKAP